MNPATAVDVSRQKPGEEKAPKNFLHFQNFGYDGMCNLGEAIMCKHLCMILLAGASFYVWPTWTYLRTSSFLSGGAVMGVEILTCAILLTLHVWSDSAPAPCSAGRGRPFPRRFR